MKRFWEVQQPYGMPDADLTRFGHRSAINPPGGWFGPTLASAATITISAPCHKLSGTTQVTTINPPYTGFTGTITLILTGAVPFATGGNIASAVTGVADQAVDFVYDGALWYPKIAD